MRPEEPNRGILDFAPGIQLSADMIKHRMISMKGRYRDSGASILWPKQASPKVSGARLGHCECRSSRLRNGYSKTVTFIQNPDVTRVAQQQEVAGLGSHCRNTFPFEQAGRRFTTAHSASVGLDAGGV